MTVYRLTRGVPTSSTSSAVRSAEGQLDSALTELAARRAVLKFPDDYR